MYVLNRTTPASGPANQTPLGHLDEVLKARAERHINGAVGDFLANNTIRNVILAGGALLAGTPEDLDLFPVANHESAFIRLLDSRNKTQLLEVVAGSHVVQLCRLQKPSLKDLCDYFDFAHCQVGVRLGFMRPEEGKPMWKAAEVYHSSHFDAAMTAQSTWYIKGYWPLHSLIRVPRVVQKLGLSVDDGKVLAKSIVDHIKEIGMEAATKDDPMFASDGFDINQVLEKAE